LPGIAAQVQCIPAARKIQDAERLQTGLVPWLARLGRPLKFDRIIGNPPFSQRSSGIKEGGTDLLHVDQALKMLAKNGRAVFIVAGPSPINAVTPKRYYAWRDELAKRFNVRADVLIDPKVYSVYGTDYPTRLLVIDHTGPTPLTKEGQPDILTGSGWVHAGDPKTLTPWLALNALWEVRNDIRTEPHDYAADRAGVPDGLRTPVPAGSAERGKPARGPRGGVVRGPTQGLAPSPAVEGTAPEPDGGEGRGGPDDLPERPDAGTGRSPGGPGTGGGPTDVQPTPVVPPSAPGGILSRVSDEKQKRFEELRKRLIEKTKGEVRIGLDPELLSIGAEMGAILLEAGARAFAAWAKAMVDEVGARVVPYLKSIYVVLRTDDDPALAPYQAEMDPAATVKAMTDEQVATLAGVLTQPNLDHLDPDHSTTGRIQMFESQTEYEPYVISDTVQRLGIKPHPGYLVSPANLVGIAKPEPFGQLSIDPKLIESGAVSQFAYEQALYAQMAHHQFVAGEQEKGKPDLATQECRQAIMFGHGTGAGKTRINLLIGLDQMGKGNRYHIYIGPKADDLLAQVRREWAALGGDDQTFRKLTENADSIIRPTPGFLFTTYRTLIGTSQKDPKRTRVLWLAGNRRSGTIPPALRADALGLWLAGNRRSGTIEPQEPRACALLWLAGNRRSGTIIRPEA
jgi:hypothetical protein